MPRWVRVASVADLPPGEGRSVVVEGHAIAFFNDHGELLAVDDTCPHQGASLGEGVLLGGRVICPRHGWTFDLRSGVSAGVPGPPVACRATRLSAGALEVEIP